MFALHHARIARQAVLAASLTMGLVGLAGAAAADEVVAMSPWGADDEIGRLNLMTDASRYAVLGRISSGKVYDLGVDYFLGMPSWQAIGDQRFQLVMTHTPRGVTVDDPFGFGEPGPNQFVSYSGDAMCLYTHTGTHADALTPTISACTARSGTASRPTSISATGAGTRRASRPCRRSWRAAC